MTSLPKVAIALFVKNEFSDIAGWIAWHLALGAKTLFIFDDHSSDGTWEIIQAAAQIYDIRAVRTDPNSKLDFYWRQSHCFMSVAEQCKGRYDWLGFLDGDEYLYLKHHDSLPIFFDNMSHADGVAFSWRIHGSSGRVVRPKITAVEAFQHHSTPDLGDNVLVKSFVRPDKMAGTYHNPHWFDVPTERYVRPNGNYVSEANAVQAIDWNDAFVMHYICRSMEHYIQRIRRRLNVDLEDSQGYWDHFDRNDVVDREPLRFIPQVWNILKNIHQEMLASAIETIRGGLYRHVAVSTPYHGMTDDRVAEVFRIRSCFDTFFYYDSINRHVLHATEDAAKERGWIPVYGAVYPSLPEVITFFVHDEGVPDSKHFLHIRCDDRLASDLVYRLLPLKEKGKYAFVNPQSGTYTVCIVPNEGHGAVLADRRAVDAWETMSLVPAPEIGYWPETAIPAFHASGETTAEQIFEWLAHSPSVPHGRDLLRVLAAVSAPVLEKVSSQVPGLLWPFI